MPSGQNGECTTCQYVWHSAVAQYAGAIESRSAGGGQETDT
jgi:hypothetical protein